MKNYYINIMIKFLNKIIDFINTYIIILGFGFFMPMSWMLPKKNKFVTVRHPHGFAFRAKFNGEKFETYPAKYKPSDLVSWSYDWNESFKIPNIPERINKENRWKGVDVLLPLARSVWYPREKVFVNTKMAKALQNDPYHTSLADKRAKQTKQAEKAKEMKYKAWRKSPFYKYGKF